MLEQQEGAWEATAGAEAVFAPQEDPHSFEATAVAADLSQEEVEQSLAATAVVAMPEQALWQEAFSAIVAVALVSEQDADLPPPQDPAWALMAPKTRAAERRRNLFMMDL